MKTALIFGINSMDGSHMAELLLEKQYIVHGTIRRSSIDITQRINHFIDKIKIHYSDLIDLMNVCTVVNNVKPDEIYNFAAQSHVKVSSELENYTVQTNTIGILNILQAVKMFNLDCKIYHASTSEMFGNSYDTNKLNENTPMNPVSIYGISKLAGYNICNMYRDAHNMFIISSILFNHESERRGHNFVTQKIAKYVAKYNILMKNRDNRPYGCPVIPMKPLKLGNIDAKRDWGESRDYMEAIYLMMQQKNPDNYVIATGETHSVREFLVLAFKIIGVELYSNGLSREQERYLNEFEEVIVEIDSKHYRDIEINMLIGDYTKAQQVLGWEPKTTFSQLVEHMVTAQIHSTN